MGFISFNRIPKHRKFDYVPRHYDPTKEELDKIVDSYRDKSNADISKERIRSGLRNRYRGDAEYKKQQQRSSNIRLLSIIFILSLITYLILRSDLIMRMLETLSS